jgi:hypothetical protein
VGPCVRAWTSEWRRHVRPIHSAANAGFRGTAVSAATSSSESTPSSRRVPSEYRMRRWTGACGAAWTAPTAQRRAARGTFAPSVSRGVPNPGGTQGYSRGAEKRHAGGTRGRERGTPWHSERSRVRKLIPGAGVGEGVPAQTRRWTARHRAYVSTRRVPLAWSQFAESSHAVPCAALAM